MNIANTKLELTKKLLNTENRDIINHIKAVFDTQEDFWNTLPDEVKESISRGIEQSEKGQTSPHSKVMKSYKKWLKK